MDFGSVRFKQTHSKTCFFVSFLRQKRKEEEEKEGISNLNPTKKSQKHPHSSLQRN